MATVGELNVVINAQDNASGVISGVASNLNSLSSAQSGVMGNASAFNTAMSGNARQSAVLASAVKQTEQKLEGLRTAQARQAEQTRAYTVSLRDSASVLREKRTAMENAARAYKTNSTALNADNEALRNQLKLLDGSAASNKEHIDALKSSNAFLNRNSDAYKANRAEIKALQAENRQMKTDRSSITAAITQNEAALRSESNAYKQAQAEVKAAAASYKSAQNAMQQSKQAESAYANEIHKTSKELENQQKAAQASQKIDRSMNRADRLRKTGARWQELSEGIDAVTKPIQIIGAASAAGLTLAGKAAVDFEDKFAAVRKTVSGTPEELDKIRQSIIDMTTVGINGNKAIPLTTKELTELAAAGGQLGIKTESITDFTETMAMLGATTNLYGADGAATLARFMNVANVSQDQVSNLGSSIAVLGNNFATTEAEIAQMALSMGATGSVVGISAQDILAYSTVLSSMGVDAMAGGSAVSRIWMDIQSAVSSGGEDLKGFAKISEKSSKEFAEQWKNDASGAFKDFLQGLSKSEDQVKVLSDLGFGNIRDITALQRLGSERGLELLTDAIERSNRAWEENAGLQDMFNTRTDTTAAKIAIAKNNAVEAARSFGEVMLPSIVDVTGGVSDLFGGMAKWNDGAKKAVVNTGLFSVGLAGITWAAKKAAKNVSTITTGFEKLSNFLTDGAFAGMGDALPVIAGGLAPVAGTLGGLAGVVGVYKLIAEHTTKTIENNAKLGQSYRELYETWENAEDKVKYISALRDEYAELTQNINSGNLKSDQLEAAKSRAADIIAEIRNLVSDDIKLMIDTGDFQTALNQAVADAQRAADDIQDALGDKKKPKKAVSEAYDSLYKGTNIGAEYNTKQERAAQWLDQAADFETKWKNNAASVADAGKDKNLRRIRHDLTTAIINEAQESGFLDTYRDLVGGDFSFNSAKEIADQIENVRQVFNDCGDSIKNMRDRANDSRKSLEAMAKTAQDNAIRYAGYDDMADVLSNGGEAVEKAVKQINSLMGDYGFHEEDIAQQTALFRKGFESLQGAIDSNALDAVVSEFINDGRKLGMTSEDIAKKAALMKNGFSDAAQAAASNDLSGFVKDLGDYGGQMGLTYEQVSNIAKNMGAAAVPLSAWARGAALALSGVDSLETAWEQAANGNGEALNKVINSYIENMKASGASASEAAAGAALLANGFRTVEDATAGGDKAVTGVLNSMRELGQQQGLFEGLDIKETAEKLTEMAQAAGLIPENKHIEINAKGNIEVVQKAYEEMEKLDGKAVGIEINVNGETSKLELTAEQAQKLRGMGAVSIAVDAEGNVDLLDDAGNKIGELRSAGDVTVAVSANGDITLLDSVSEEVRELISSGQISLHMSADGNIEVLDRAKQKLGEIKQEPEAKIKVTAEADISADGEGLPDKIKSGLSKLTTTASAAEVDVPVDVNAAPGNITAEGLSERIMEVLSGVGESADVAVDGKINYTTGEITPPENVTADGVINYTGNYDGIGDPPEKSGTASYTGNYDGVAEAPERAGVAKYSGDFKGVGEAPAKNGVAKYSGDFSGIGSAPTLHGTIVYAARYEHQARGTQSFRGGLAMVNDQRGVSDPRELIIDRGRAFIPQGRDVILPLSRGARVYTAAQTRAIMAKLGIARYASGKDNSDAFISARDSLNHQLKIKSFTTSEELEKWVALLHEAAETEKDIEECEEQIFSLTKRRAQEKNSESKSYIEVRAALNDWSEYGDSAEAAFERVKKRNKEQLEAGVINWEEYSESIHDIGEAVYDGRQELSYKWMQHERDYNNMSTLDYMAHLQQMAADTKSFYELGIIDKRKYIEEATEIDEKYLDAYREHMEEQLEIRKTAFEKQMKLSEAYADERSYFNDWPGFNDSPFDAYQRVNDRVWEEKQKETLTEEEGDELLRDYASRLFNSGIDRAKSLLEEQRKYFNMSDKEYVEAINGIKKYSAQFRRELNIDRVEYGRVITEMNHLLWDRAADSYDDMLSREREHISKLRDRYSKQEQEFRDRYESSVRSGDIAETRRLMNIYAGAVTERGQQKYEELRKQLEQYEYQERLYQLQEDNQETLERLENRYEQLEEQKAEYIKGIAQLTDKIDMGAVVTELERGNTSHIANKFDLNISGMLKSLERNYSDMTREIIGAVKQVADAIEDKEIMGPVQNFNDNRNVNISRAEDYAIYAPFLAGLKN